MAEIIKRRSFLGCLVAAPVVAPVVAAEVQQARNPLPVSGLAIHRGVVSDWTAGDVLYSSMRMMGVLGAGQAASEAEKEEGLNILSAILGMPNRLLLADRLPVHPRYITLLRYRLAYHLAPVYNMDRQQFRTN